MIQAHRVDPRATALKDFFATINRFPRKARQFPLAKPQAIEKLAIAAHIRAPEIDTPADEQVRHVTKGLCLSLFLSELKRQDPDRNLILGLLCFWHSYLEPISAANAVTPLSPVLVHCSRVENLREFLRAAQEWIRVAYGSELRSQQELAGLLVPEHFRKIVLVGVPTRPTDSERRTYGNYLNLAARQIALRMEAVVPVLFASEQDPQLPSETQQQVNATQERPTSVLPKLVEIMLRWCSSLPETDGACLPIENYVRRNPSLKNLRGEPRFPELVGEDAGNVIGMSGFLSGVLGSGRSAFLQHLTWQYANAWRERPQRPIAFYFSAPDFAPYARNRRSIYEFIVDQVLAQERLAAASDEWLVELRQLDKSGKLLLLVEDFDRLSEVAQAEIMGMLTFSPAVVYTALPWQVSRLAELGPRAHLGLIEVLPVEQVEHQTMVCSILSQDADHANVQRALQLLRQLPDLGKSVLGLVTITLQAAGGESNPTTVVEKALGEFVRRCELPSQPDKSSGLKLGNEWEDLLGAAEHIHGICLAPDHFLYARGQRDLVVVRSQVEITNGSAWRMKWDEVIRTGLFEPVPHAWGEGAAVVNRDLTCYLMAFACWWNGWLFRQPSAVFPPETRDLLTRAEQHWAELNQQAPVKRWLELEQARLASEDAALRAANKGRWAWIPELFRSFA